MLLIREVEMVASLDELKSSRSVDGKEFPNFEMLDAKIATALNKIIQNSHFKKKVSLEQQKAPKEDRGHVEDRLRLWLMTIFEWLALMIRNCIMLIYSLLFFAMMIFRTSMQDDVLLFFVKESIR